MPHRKTAVKIIPDRLLRRLVDDEIMLRIDASYHPAATRTTHIEIKPHRQSPGRAGPAVICRLYPRSDSAHLTFGLAGQTSVEAIVFEDPDDQLAWNLNAGFENALYVAHTLTTATNQ